jgi:seryl-tRNA synthetase
VRKTTVADLRQRGQELKQILADPGATGTGTAAKIRSILITITEFTCTGCATGAKMKPKILNALAGGDEYKSKIDVLPHWEIAEKLRLFETERATKIAQSRFVTLWGAGGGVGASLDSMGCYITIFNGVTSKFCPPFLVNSQALTGTGQLPKFSQESFACREDDLWLIPTAEVPVTNLYRDEILSAAQLPIYHCAWTPCFRREAGSYGRDTRGLIRLHQFNKVELVKIVHPETSAQEHEQLVQDAATLLEALKLPYRVVELCTGDLGFAAQKCYDLEVWLPAQKNLSGNF